MALYDINGNAVTAVYDINGNALNAVYDINGDNIDFDGGGEVITYTVPSISDFTYEISGANCVLKSYNGSATAIKLPTSVTISGSSYTVSLDSMTLPDAVEHIYIPSSISGHVTYSDNASLKTLISNGAYNYKTILSATEIFAPNKSNFSSLNIVINNTNIEDASGLIYPQSMTALSNVFYGFTALKNGGTIPQWVTIANNLFFGCTHLERFKVDSKIITNIGNWITSVPATCKCFLHPDSNTFANYKRLAPQGSGHGAGSANPVLHLLPYDSSETIKTIICMGDSLTIGTGSTDNATKSYPARLNEKVPSNCLVFNEGQGSTTTENHKTRLAYGYNTQYFDSDCIVILWTGTNGNTSSDKTIATLETMIDEMVDTLGEARFLLPVAVASTLQSSETPYNEHMAWLVEKYGSEHVFDVYGYFRSLGYTRSEYMSDNLHYNDDGYQVIANGIYSKLVSNGWITS